MNIKSYKKTIKNYKKTIKKDFKKYFTSGTEPQREARYTGVLTEVVMGVLHTTLK